MSSLTHRTAGFGPAARSIAIAALLGATFLAGPSTAARAAEAPGETVEQRITTLHAELKITPAEDAKWNDVAQAMRENEAAMQKLAADKTTVAPQGMTAIDDLKGYETFAQAHVDGLKNLLASFTTLYGAMPDPQKKIADQVFQNFGHKGAQAHS